MMWKTGKMIIVKNDGKVIVLILLLKLFSELVSNFYDFFFFNVLRYITLIIYQKDDDDGDNSGHGDNKTVPESNWRDDNEIYMLSLIPFVFFFFK